MKTTLTVIPVGTERNDIGLWLDGSGTVFDFAFC